MKSRRMVIILISLCVLCCISCGEQRPPVQVDESKLVYFKTTYEESRKAFLDEAGELKAKYKNATVSALQIKSSKNDDLFIDLCFIPARKKTEHLLILSSGIHGIEGFTGSALQCFIMKELLPSWNLDKIGVLFIHSMNPYGFKYKRRVTENNVDLNRNLSSNKSLFSLKNEGYRKIILFLNPEEKADPGSIGNRFFPVRAVFKIVQYSMSTLRDAIMKGQYEYNKGIYFGGKDFEPQKGLLQTAILGASRGCRSVLLIDLHTGYGERGKMHIYPNPVKDKKVKASMDVLFKGYKVDWGDEGDFYATTGDLLTFGEEILPKNVLFLQTLFEFGTVDTQTTMGSLRALQTVILENQGFQYGYASDDSKKEIEERYMEAYFPSSKEWRSEAIRQVKEMLPVFVDRYSKM